VTAAADRLLALADALPEGGTVVLDAGALRRLAGIEPEHDDVTGGVVLDDLTPETAGELIGKSPSTVRGWCAAGSIPGSYKLGRTWRIPRAALRSFLDGKATKPRESERRQDPQPVALGRWRRSYRGSR